MTPSGGAQSCWSSNGSTTTSPTSARCATTSATPSSTPTPGASANNYCASTTRSPDIGCSAAPSIPAAPRLHQLPDPTGLHAIAADIGEVVALALDHGVVRDRFTGTAVLTAEQAFDLGTFGYVARASGLTLDARHDHPTTDRTTPPHRAHPHRG